MIYVIAHTHWDREWYFTENRSIIYSLVNFDEIVNYLEDNDNFDSFLLDGQTSIIDDYIKFRPENEIRVKKLIKDKRIITGPWFTQTDTLVIDGESIIRNLLIGTREAKNLGGYQKIGYLPDSFGMNEQMPMIYYNFGLKYTAFRRGIADHLMNKREFIWKSPSGKEIKAFNIYHYGNMAYPPNNIRNLYYEELSEKLNSFGNESPYILFNGEDQKPIRKNLPDLIKGFDNIKISNLEDALDEVFDNENELEHYLGEFTYGQFSRVHKTIFSTRADLKIKNNRIERYLSKIVEPLSSLYMNLGFRYEKELIDSIWKLILKNAAHDSIGMCNSDKTNSEIESRYDKAIDLSKNLVDIMLRRIGDNIKEDTFDFQIYNTLPFERTEIIECTIYSPFEYVDIYLDGEKLESQILRINNADEVLSKSMREIGVNNAEDSKLNEFNNLYELTVKFKASLPSMGYKTFNIVEKKSVEIFEKDKENDFIENEFYKISILSNGHLKVEGCGIEEIYIENSGDEGDSYDYSTPTNDKVYNVGKVLRSWVYKDSFSEKLTVKLERILPLDLKHREKGIEDKNILTYISAELIKGSNEIKISYSNINSIIESRERIAIKTSEKSNYSIADEQFGTIKRSTEVKDFKWKENNWDEKPIGINPMMSFVAYGTDKKIQAVTDGVREYEVDDNTIYITMYRSIPYLGKPNLNNRPGRASGVYEIQEDHELIGKRIETNIYIRATDDDYYGMHKFSNMKLIKPISYQAGEILDNTDNFVISKAYERLLPKEKSLFKIEKNLIMTALKKSEYNDNYIIRVYNPDLENKEDISFTGKIELINRLLADEKTISNENMVNQCDIATLEVKLE